MPPKAPPKKPEESTKWLDLEKEYKRLEKAIEQKNAGAAKQIGFHVARLANEILNQS